VNTEPVCPRCRADLDPTCAGCGWDPRPLRGILDLRVGGDGLLEADEDRAIALALDREFHALDFPRFLERYFDLAGVPIASRRGQVEHILAAGAREAREEANDEPDAGPILDLGCGAAPFAAELGRRREVVCCDIALRWLILARKRLDEAGLTATRVVRASAEALPWRDATFARIVAGDMIEHVLDPESVIAEAFRVLRPGGELVMTTPNRFSPTPEPHVALIGVGFLPRAWMSRYVSARGRGDFRAIRTHGVEGWRRIIAAGPFGRCEISAPRISNAELALMRHAKQRLARIYNRLSTHALVARFGPMLRIVCRKPEAR
jgi:SAM-dependent methyltransferase